MWMLKQGLAVTSSKGITSSEVFNASFPLCILMSHKTHTRPAYTRAAYSWAGDEKSTLLEHFGGNPKRDVWKNRGAYSWAAYSYSFCIVHTHEREMKISTLNNPIGQSLISFQTSNLKIGRVLFFLTPPVHGEIYGNLYRLWGPIPMD